MDYVVEWSPLLEIDVSLTQFNIIKRNQTSLLITGMFYTVCIAVSQICDFTHLLFRFRNLLLILYHENSLQFKFYLAATQPLCTHC